MSGTVTFSDAQSLAITDNLGFALRVMEGSNEYVRFVTTDGSEEVDFSKSVKLDGGMTLGGGISIPASQDITLVASNSNALDFVIASGNRMMRFNTSTETVLMEQNIDVDGTANLDAVDIDGDVDLAGDLTFSAAKDIQLIDNNAAALEIAEAGNNYLVFTTTDGSEKITTAKTLDVTGGLSISGTAVTSTAAELNILDGVTSTAAELNILDGVTATAAEINVLDGPAAGTVSASKAVVVDSNKDITGFRNLTASGTVTIDSVGVAAIQTSGESFADNDTSLMTSAAIEDRFAPIPVEGTFTATLAGAGGEPGSAVTTTGRYFRIGKEYRINIFFNNVDTSSYSGEVSITGLPATVKDLDATYYIGSCWQNSFISGATDSLMPVAVDNTTTIKFIENNNANFLAFGTVGSGRYLRLQITYTAA